MPKDAYTSKKWSVWAQPDGPNTKAEYLGCHTVDDITESLGGTELLRCFRADGTGWDIIGSTQDPPDPITVSITVPIFENADWLEKVSCPFTIFINGVKCGRKDLFTNWERSFALNLATTVEKGLTGLAHREEDNISEQSFNYEARPPVHRLYDMVVAQQDTSETEDLLDINFCNVAKCADACGEAAPICESGFITTSAAAGSPTNVADIIYTGDEGNTWTPTAADPFAGGEDIVSGTCFYVDTDTIRWLVVREADAGAALEVAYSDDGGVTWTLVVVGAVVGQGANYGGALFSIDKFHIWLAVDGGYIYFSEDGGETWEAQQEGNITVQDLNAVWGANEDDVMVVGDADVILLTGDGGSTWVQVTATGGGNDLLCVGFNPYGLWWIGDDGAELYFSYDDGTTWTQRTGWTGSGTGDIRDIQFANELCGFMIRNTAAPVGSIYRTIDGGFTWQQLDTPTNTGLNSLWVCGCNLAYAVGNDGMILKAYGS